MSDDDELWRLIQEAVAACGANIAKIERFIEEKRGAMSDEEKARVAKQIEKGLSGVNEPDRPFKSS